MINFCDILELDFDFTEKELKSAYRRLSKVYHPDANSGSTEYVEKFRLLTEAYEKLLILLKSGKYDKWKSSQQKKTQNQSNKKESTNFEADNFSFFEFVNKEGLFEEDNYSSSENKKHHVPNDIIEVGSFSYKVTKFIFLKEFGNESFKASSDGYFIIIDLEIQNISKSMISIHNYMYRLFDKEGFFYEFSSE
ncbi:MAG: DnaJ domain-containing protein [Fluviicola sp.]|nr:DnaJ domain-containing protein [Fluviicola sp.]